MPWVPFIGDGVVGLPEMLETWSVCISITVPVSVNFASERDHQHWTDSDHRRIGDEIALKSHLLHKFYQLVDRFPYGKNEYITHVPRC